LSLYSGIATRPCRGPFQIVVIGFTPDKGKHFRVQTFVVGMN